MKKKLGILILFNLLLFTSCTQKFTYKVGIYYEVPGEPEERIDTLEIKTTRMYPRLVLKDGSDDLLILEPTPLMPWRLRERTIHVGQGQAGFKILGRS